MICCEAFFSQATLKQRSFCYVEIIPDEIRCEFHQEYGNCSLKISIGGTTMPAEENKAVVKRHVEEWSNKNEAGAIDELVARNMVSHDSDGINNPHGFEE